MPLLPTSEPPNEQLECFADDFIQEHILEASPRRPAIQVFTELEALHIRDGKILERRVVLDRVITDVFVAALVDALQAAAYINAYKYHDSGTGTVAEAAADTALGTPCGEARDTGTQVEGATANIYKSVATHTYAGTFAITEHGLFNAASAGTLLDRSKFAAINVVSGSQIQFTYQATFTAGG